IRTLDEMRPGDCFDRPPDDSDTAKLIACNTRHNAQLTHRFELPDGAFPGESVVKDRVDSGCDARWAKMFDRDPPPVRIEEWYYYPTQETWRTGDRLVLCYVTGAKERDLNRSVVPRK
ncbi:septum formation family protein, partial [Actinomadura adrarensis]